MDFLGYFHYGLLWYPRLVSQGRSYGGLRYPDSLPPDRSPGPARAQHSQMDFVVETCDALMCPVFPQLGQNVAQSIRPVAREERSFRLPKWLPRSMGVGISATWKKAFHNAPTHPEQREVIPQALPQAPHSKLGLTW